MRKLLDDYLERRQRVLLFGIASDASSIHGWGSSSAGYRMLTDFGAVGLRFMALRPVRTPLRRLWREGAANHAHPVILSFCS